MNFIDGEINKKTIKNLYLDMEKSEEFKKSKNFKSY